MIKSLSLSLLVAMIAYACGRSTERHARHGADLRGAYLRGAYLRGADLRGADLRDAYLDGAYLDDAERD